jgi:hypothetical protein
MKALADFHLEIRPEVPGAPIALVNRALVNTAIEFCDYTLTWRDEIDTQGIRADQNTYDLDAPSCARVAAVLYAGHNDVRVMPGNERNLDDNVDGWRQSTNTSDAADYYYLPDRKTIRLALTPGTTLAGGLDIFCAFKPTVTAEYLPDVLYNDHLEAIGRGAKARLLIMAGMPWANPQLGLAYGQLFEEAKVKERAERFNDYTRESTFSANPPNYWSG